MEQLSICENSTIDGEFGVFTEHFTIERITFLKGLVFMKFNKFFTTTQSSISAKRMVIKGTNTTILGKLELQSDDSYNPTL